MLRDIVELVKTKTGLKDVVLVEGKYFEAKTLKQYLKLFKDLENVRFSRLESGVLYVEHDSGAATFNPVTVWIVDGDKAYWYAHDVLWNDELEKYVDKQGKKAKIRNGELWQFKIISFNG